MTKRERAEAAFGKVFTPLVHAALREMGAVEVPDSAEVYGTPRAGVLNVIAYDIWIACYFSDVERAREIADKNVLKLYSGKYNFMYDTTENPKECVAGWMKHIKTLLAS